ncbi:MAG: putative methyltransferase [Mycobacterium sp.]|nr:putative methyltransferase [Mycobacterium sp.]
MLTVDFDRFPVGPGDRVLDLGCGGGRHAFEVYRRGADVTAVDMNADELDQVEGLFGAMKLAGEAPADATAETVNGDATNLPFDDASFDRVIAAEVMEHIPDDAKALGELTRVLKPGGLVAVTVPAWLPEKVCWALSDAYHEVPGGHIRIYRKGQLVERLQAAGLEYVGSHHAHALHAPYWWLKCAVGVNKDPLPVRLYHKLLVWDIVKAPKLTRTAEQLLNPVLGKSIVVYARKPGAGA